jgi:hypothetical protein
MYSQEFLVQEVPYESVLEPGTYVAEIEWVDLANYPVEVHWLIKEGPHAGTLYKEYYKIKDDRQIVRDIAVRNLSKLFIDIGDVQPGMLGVPENLLGKMAFISITKKASKNDPNVMFTNISAKKPYVSHSQQTQASLPTDGGISLPFQPIQPTAIVSGELNDDVPY